MDLRVCLLEANVFDALIDSEVARAYSSIRDDKSTPSADPLFAATAASRVVWPVPQPKSRTRSASVIAAAAIRRRWNGMADRSK